MNSLIRFCVLGALFVGSAALAADKPQPVQVYVGLHVIEMRQVDARTQSFYGDFYVWLRFNSNGLSEERIAQLSHIEPVNGKFESQDITDNKQAGEEHYICYRVTGTFFFIPELKKYPFDTQTLPVTLEFASLDSDEAVFVDDKISYARGSTPEVRWGLSPTLAIPDYTLKRVERSVFTADYPTNFGDPTKSKAGIAYSRFTLKVAFEREYWSYAFKILIPLLIILAMAYLVFFLPPAQLDTAASVAMTALLSCMAYNVAVSQNMPEIGYLVLSDKFFIATYVLLLLTLAQTFATFVLDSNGKTDSAKRLDKMSAIAFPLLVVGIFAFFLLGV
ncbi:MAG: hypothetical protein QM817_29080 [Archangium sp.]